MHEMSLAESVLQIIEDTARTEQCARVKIVRLEIGQLAGVEAEALRFCFDVVTRDSVAQDAQLEIIETAGLGKCTQCGCEAQIATLYEACPQCGSFALSVIGGDAMRVKELEVE